MRAERLIFEGPARAARGHGRTPGCPLAFLTALPRLTRASSSVRGIRTRILSFLIYLNINVVWRLVRVRVCLRFARFRFRFRFSVVS